MLCPTNFGSFVPGGDITRARAVIKVAPDA